MRRREEGRREGGRREEEGERREEGRGRKEEGESEEGGGLDGRRRKTARRLAADCSRAVYCCRKRCTARGRSPRAPPNAALFQPQGKVRPRPGPSGGGLSVAAPYKLHGGNSTTRSLRAWNECTKREYAKEEALCMAAPCKRHVVNDATRSLRV